MVLQGNVLVIHMQYIVYVLQFIGYTLGCRLCNVLCIGFLIDSRSIDDR
jgi:hypothetical protein